MNVEDNCSESSSLSLSSSSSSEDDDAVPLPTVIPILPMEIAHVKIGLQRRRNTLAMHILRKKARRESRFIYCRARFTEWLGKMKHNIEFRREVRMDYDAFDTLLGLIRDDLAVNQDMAARRGGLLPLRCASTAH
jgi:hypothetical protein